MNPRTAKLVGLLATFVGVVVVGSRSIKQGGAFDAKGVLGVTVWGATSVLVASFAPEIGAVLGGFLLADVLVLPTASGKPTAAELLGTLLTGGKATAAPPGAASGPVGPGETPLPGMPNPNQPSSSAFANPQRGGYSLPR